MERKIDLVFKDWDKNKELLTVSIISEEFEGMQVKMFFGEKNNIISLIFFKWVGNYIPKDIDWIPQRFLKPAIRQARAIFADYRRRRARLIS